MEKVWHLILGSTVRDREEKAAKAGPIDDQVTFVGTWAEACWGPLGACVNQPGQQEAGFFI